MFSCKSGCFLGGFLLLLLVLWGWFWRGSVFFLAKRNWGAEDLKFIQNITVISLYRTDPHVSDKTSLGYKILYNKRTIVVKELLPVSFCSAWNLELRKDVFCKEGESFCQVLRQGEICTNSESHIFIDLGHHQCTKHPKH